MENNYENWLIFEEEWQAMHGPVSTACVPAMDSNEFNEWLKSFNE